MSNGEHDGVALVIGAGDGLGSAVGRRFAQGGYLAALVRRDHEKAQRVVAEIASNGGRAHAFSADARSEDEVCELFAGIEDDLGPIQACVYNAGANAQAPLRDTSAKLFSKAWELACFGGFLAVREAARYMVPRGRGTILFTGATASVRGGAGFAAFASAKAGLRAVAQSAARELGPQNVHVAHIVIDSAIRTEAIRRRFREQRDIDIDSLLEASVARPESIAEVYWQLHVQPRDCWTHELDLRPSLEKW